LQHPSLLSSLIDSNGHASLQNTFSSHSDVDSFISLLKDNPTITSVDLSSNNLDEQSVIRILQEIAVNPSIKQVDISGNRTGCKTAGALLQVGASRVFEVKHDLLDAESIIREAKEALGEIGRAYDESEDTELEPFRIYVGERQKLLSVSQVPLVVQRGESLRNMCQHILKRQFIAGHRVELESIEIKRPLFVVGLPRTGTTLLFNLLASAEGTRSARYWEIRNPIPPPKKENYFTDPRLEKEKRTFAEMYKNPFFREVLKMHEMMPEMPEECTFMFHECFFWIMLARMDVYPKYTEWFNNQPKSRLFAKHKQLLQVLSYNYPAEDHWTLKSPLHLGMLDALFEAYPDANVVFCHREPTECIASCISLQIFTRKLHHPQMDEKYWARELVKVLANDWKKAFEVLDSAEERGRSNQIHHVYFDDLMNKPFETAREIHKKFGYAVNNDFDEKMQAWLDEHPRGKFGAHKYTLEQFGLTKEEIGEIFEEYNRRFFASRKP